MKISIARSAGYIVSAICLFAVTIPVHAAWELDLESGAAFTGYNEVQVPGDTGTRFSLTQDLDSRPAFFLRGRLTWSPGVRHHISLLIAPLRIEAEGSMSRPLEFLQEIFATNTPLDVRYRFDSYRLTYRYDFLHGRRWRLGAGITAKVRDAAISVQGDGRHAETSDLGLIPLVHFRIQRFATQAPVSLLLEGDALAGPQGRAVDALGALTIDVDPALGFKLGYRILEGGADVAQVYNFALVHYAVFGLVARF